MKWKVCVGFLALIIFSNVANAQSCGWTPIPPVNSACGTWQMYGGSQKHTGIQRMKADMSSGRFVKWSYEVGGWAVSSPAIGDINNDGIPEVVVGGLFVGRIYVLRGNNGSLLWSYTTGSSSISSPAIGDINNDGIPEVVVGSSNGAVYALRGTNGSLLWSYTTGGSVSSPAIGDINNDGILDVVVGSNDNKIYALRGDNGSLLWSYTTGNLVNSSPAIGDINNDGIPDVVVGSNDNKIYALRGDNGSLLWSVSLPSYQYWQDGIKLADIDPSPGLEVIASTFGDNVYIISSNGNILWSAAPVGQMRNSSLGDVDNDNCVEIVVVGEGTPKIAVIDVPGSNCGTITPVEISETNKLNYQIEKNGIKLNRAVNYELFSANGRLIKKGYGDFINIKNKGIYFLKAENEVLKFVID